MMTARGRVEGGSTRKAVGRKPRRQGLLYATSTSLALGGSAEGG